MKDSPQTTLLRGGRYQAAGVGYFVAAIAVGVATLVRVMLDPLLGGQSPFFTYVTAVAVVAGVGRTPTAILALVGGGVLAVYLFVPPRYTFALTAPDVLSGLASYLFVGSVVVGMGHALRAARRRAEDARPFSDDIADAVREPLLVLDSDLRVRSASRAFYTTFHATPDQAEGRLVYELGDGRWDTPTLRRLLGEVLPQDAQPHDCEVEYDSPSIGKRVRRLNARRLHRPGSRTELILLAIEDVTDRRRSEREAGERLRAARLLAAIIESSDDAIISKSLDGIVQSWNAAAERLFGHTAAEAVGRHISLVIPPDRADEEGRIIASIKAGRRVEHFDTVRVRKDGTPVHVALTVSPVRDEAGRVVGASKIVRDISDRIAAARSLRESEDRAAFVRRASGVGFWYCDLPFDTLQWDDLVKAHFHLPPDAPVTIDTFYARIHPDDREPTRRAIDRSIRDRTGYDTAYRTVAADGGAVKWVRAIGRTFYAADGTPTRFDGVTLDVTDQKRAEVELREARGFLHATLDALSSHIAVLDENGLILEVNETWRNFAARNDDPGANLGVGGNYVAGCERTLGGSAAASGAGDGLRAVMAGRLDTFSMEYACHGPTERRWFLMRVTRFEEGGRPRFVVAHEPITVVKLAEERLRESEERYRTLVEQVKEHAIFGTDTGGRATTWNEGVRKVLGFEEAEFVGQDIGTTIFTPEDVAGGVPQRELDEAAATGSASDDRWMMRKDGTQFWAAGITTARRDDAGRLIGFTKVMRDMTAQKAMENELRQLAADLSEADRRKDEFLATLAHELRNPLAPIRNGLQILRLASGRGIDYDKPLAMMERQLGQMVRLVDDLLDVSRISRGKIELKKQRVPLAAVVEQAVETSRPLIEQAGHELVLDLPPDPIVVDADVTRLAQVFANLLNNAAKYTDRGGRIRLAVERQGGGAAVSVEDTGVGIPAPMLPKVFDLFTQVDRSLEKSQGGLGIGLTLVRRLVEMHGGSVEARSDGPGRGCTFVVRVAAVPAADPPAAGGPPARPSGRRRIVVADDNLDSAESLSMLLTVMGHEVGTAHDGEQAVEAAGQFRPDVVFLDIGMPKLNGYETCRRMREQPWGRHITLVALTGWGQDEDRRKSQEAGFDHHLVKPVDPADLDKLLVGLKR